MSYEYLNTRVRVLLAKLLKPRQFAALLELHSLEAMVSMLAETDYVLEIQRASVEYSGYELIEQAVARNAQRAFRKLAQMAPDEPKQLIELLLERFEVFNLKTILRGYHAQISPEETARSLYPSILYPPAFYQELLKYEHIRGLLDYLLGVGNRYYKPLAEAFPHYERTGKLATLEHALDAFYFSHARATLGAMKDKNAQLIRTVLGTEADILNLVYALRVLEAGIRTAEKYHYILDAGERLSPKFAHELLECAEKSAFFKMLERTAYYRVLQPLDERVTAAQFQDRLENFLYRDHCYINKQELFDIKMSVAYIWRKIAEMTNLRVIASGLSRGVSRAQIEANLIPLEVLR